MKCKFTEIIHGKGWTAWDACKWWGIRYDVWRRKCRNVKLEAHCEKLLQLFVESAVDAGADADKLMKGVSYDNVHTH